MHMCATKRRDLALTVYLAQLGNLWLLCSCSIGCKSGDGHELFWLETGAICERSYWVGEQWYNLRPVALAEFRVGQQQIRFWLEWD